VLTKEPPAVQETALPIAITPEPSAEPEPAAVEEVAEPPAEVISLASELTEAAVHAALAAAEEAKPAEPAAEVEAAAEEAAAEEAAVAAEEEQLMDTPPEPPARSSPMAMKTTALSHVPVETVAVEAEQPPSFAAALVRTLLWAAVVAMLAYMLYELVWTAEAPLELEPPKKALGLKLSFKPPFVKLNQPN